MSSKRHWIFSVPNETPLVPWALMRNQTSRKRYQCLTSNLKNHSTQDWETGRNSKLTPGLVGRCKEHRMLPIRPWKAWKASRVRKAPILQKRRVLRRRSPRCLKDKILLGYKNMLLRTINRKCIQQCPLETVSTTISGRCSKRLW